MGKTIKHHITKLPNKVRNLVTDNVYTLEITQMNKDLWRVEYTNHSIKETTFLTFGDTKEEAIDKMIAYMNKDANWAIDQFKQKEVKMRGFKNLMTDAELERFCESNPDCGCDCQKCEAFAANYRCNNGY